MWERQCDGADTCALSKSSLRDIGKMDWFVALRTKQRIARKSNSNELCQQGSRDPLLSMSPRKAPERAGVNDDDDPSTSVMSTPSRVAKRRKVEVADQDVSPSSIPRSKTFGGFSTPLDSPSPTLTPSPVKKSRTYAGGSRSFLVELPSLSEGDLPSLVGNREDPEARESYTDLRVRWGLDEIEDEPITASPIPPSPRKGSTKRQTPQVLQNGMMNDLKSISELRSKGESRRFLDEVGYLFEGMNQTDGIALRRASALDLVSKFSNSDFVRKAKAADILGRVWDVLRGAGAGNGDKVLDVTLAFFTGLVAKDPGFLSDLANKSDLTATLFDILGRNGPEKDVIALLSAGAGDAALNKLGVLRTEKPLLTRILNLISKSDVLPEGVPASTRLILSQVLAALPAAQMHASHIATLCSSLQLELSQIQACVAAYLKGDPLLPNTSDSYLPLSSFEFVENGLWLLDGFLLGQWIEDQSRIGKDALPSSCRNTLLEGLFALCIASEVMVDDDDYTEKRPLAYRCVVIALRILVNLTHDDPEWSEHCLLSPFAFLFVTRAVIKAHSSLPAFLGDFDDDIPIPPDVDESRSLDRLCLSLALMTNLIQETDGAKKCLRTTYFDPSCKRLRNCIQNCHCPKRVSTLESIVSIYLQQDASNGGPMSAFIRGHLAALFGLAIRDSDENRSLLLDLLPGSSDRSKLDVLEDEAKKFSSLHADTPSDLVQIMPKQSTSTHSSVPIPKLTRY